MDGEGRRGGGVALRGGVETVLAVLAVFGEEEAEDVIASLALLIEDGEGGNDEELGKGVKGGRGREMS